MSSRFLIHIMPRIFLATELQEFVKLVDVSIPEFGLTLRHGHELAVRRPFPNKRYLIPCLRSPRKATEGFIISVPECPASYTVITTWELAETRTVSHIVRHEMLDRELGAASAIPDILQGESLTLNDKLQFSSTVSTIQMPTIDQERLFAHHQTNSRFPDPMLALECIADLSSNVEAMEGETLS